MSDKSLLIALAAVQAEAISIPKDKENAHFHNRYASLDTIVEKVGPKLTEHGLVWVTLPSSDEHGPALEYKLAHAETGEALTGKMPLLLDRQNSQGLGSALTYARRYALCSVLNLVSDDDDDGNGASGSDRPGRTAEGVTANDKQIGLVEKLIREKKPTEAQLNFMLIEVGAKDVQVEPGWTKKLTGGREGTASALIDWLIKRPLPDTDHPSDMAGYGDPPPVVDQASEVTHLGGEAA